VKKVLFFVLLVVVCLSAISAVSFARTGSGHGATLYMGPATGTFTTGSIFTVSFYVDTAGDFINAVETKILFPPDKIQVVSPSTGSSFINVWAIQPSFSNTQGTISFRGAVPSPGVNTDSGLISTVTFRVKSVGDAVIRFSDDSRVLLNDGFGTDILQQKQSGVYRLTLPPPAGPIVASESHPDQTRWYSNPNASLSWAGDTPANGYSYVLNDSPVDIPDLISEGQKTYAIYSNLSPGRHYFHVKALRAGVWGGTTHFAINVDNAPPADFPIELIPSNRTSRHDVIVRFLTTDLDSGIDYYEVKIVTLDIKGLIDSELLKQQQFFIEAESPYIPPTLPYGSYDVIVRAYDKAGNAREVVQRLEVVTPLFQIIKDEGISVKETFVIPWWMVWLFAVTFLVFLGIIAWRLEQWHKRVHQAHSNKELPDEVNEKLDRLKDYQRKYGKIAVILLMAVVIVFGSISPALASTETLSPPVISEVSRNIFNDEIFYVGGRTANPGTEVIIFLQSLEGGSTISQRVFSDDDGIWFYRHPSFLVSGNYLMWAQARQNNALSPPSPQVAMTVGAHAIQLGASRFSYTSLYLLTILLLLIVMVGLVGVIIHHYRAGKRKHAEFKAEVDKAEESVRRGFAVLRRDLQAEFDLIEKAKMSKELTAQERRRRAELLRDLDIVKGHIGEELWELEKKEA